MSYLSPEEFSQLMHILRSGIGNDPAQAERLAFGIRKWVPELVEALKNINVSERLQKPFPKTIDVTAAQATIFDNWSANGGRKPSKAKREKGARAERFKVAIEVWTGTTTAQIGQAGAKSLRLTNANAAFVGTAHLMDGPTLNAKAESLLPLFRKKGCDWEDYAQSLMSAWVETDRRVGPVFTTWRGTHYHLGLIALLDGAALLPRGQVKLTVASMGDEIVFSHWSTDYPDGTPLKGNAILTSRITNIVQKRGWATGPLALPNPTTDDPT